MRHFLSRSLPTRVCGATVLAFLDGEYFGGKGIRTPDFQLAKLALYQLSYAPGKN